MRLLSKPTRALRKRGSTWVSAFSSSRWVVTSTRTPRPMSSSSTAMASAAPSRGSVSAAISSISARAPGPAPSRMRFSSRTWALKVDRSWARSCASPTAECTEVKSGSWEPDAAGIWRPARSRTAQRPTRGEGDGLPARVGSRDHQRPHFLAEPDVVRHHLPAPEDQERMPELEQDQRPVGVLDHRGGRVQVGPELRRRLGLVELRRRIDSLEDARRLAAHRVRELLQDAPLLLQRHRLGDRQVVSDAHQRLRLDEERLSGLARVVDDARYLGPRLRQHRDDVPVVAQGVVVLAQVEQEALVVEQPVQA